MNLKKSDKMIAIIGVVILIVAAVSIVYYYVSTEDEVGEPTEEEIPIFDVECEEIPELYTPSNTDFNVKEKLLGSKVYTEEVKISQDNLKCIDFVVDYSDKNMLFGVLGKDTLTITVSDMDGNMISESITGSGNDSIHIDIGTMISTKSIEAETEQEARKILEERYVFYDETYIVEVSVDRKEIILFRPLAWLLEQLGGDTFDLQITYTSYNYDVDERIPNDDGNNDDGNNTIGQGEGKGTATHDKRIIPLGKQ